MFYSEVQKHNLYDPPFKNSKGFICCNFSHIFIFPDSRDVGQGSYLHRSKNNSKFHSLSFLCITCEACQGHKLTCLVLTMSFFILTGLAIAILFIECLYHLITRQIVTTNYISY